jgi:hypothetical protein
MKHYHAVLFYYLQGQLDLAFFVEDEEWFYARGTEYRFASRMIEDTFYNGVKP